MCDLRGLKFNKTDARHTGSFQNSNLECIIRGIVVDPDPGIVAAGRRGPGHKQLRVPSIMALERQEER